MGPKTVQIEMGDCAELLRTLESDSIDSLVTDPPAGISFMGKDWDGDKGGRREWVAWLESVMRECIRVMKPGAHGLVWALPRTSHWTATALEDAGFRIKDQCFHIFGSGFPKSTNVKLQAEKAGIACVCRKDVCDLSETMDSENALSSDSEPDLLAEVRGPESQQVKTRETDQARREVPSVQKRVLDGQPITQTCGRCGKARFAEGYGSALKPAVEVWILIQKPIEKGLTISANVLKWGTGALNIDGSRIASDQPNPSIARRNGPSRLKEMPGGWKTGGDGQAFNQPHPGENLGRFPANLVLSHAPECEESPHVYPDGSTESQCALWCPVRGLDEQSGGNDSSMLKSAACGPRNTRAVATFAGKKAASTSSVLSIDGFGSGLTVQFLRDTISITETETHSTISFPISNASKQTPIGICTIETERTIDQSEAKSIVSVNVAANGNCSLTLASDPLEPIRGIARVVFGNISASGANAIASTGTNTIANIAPGPSRFFYVAKISKGERNAGCEDIGEKRRSDARPNSGDPTGKFPDHDNRVRSGNFHPTVKPKKLMSYLIRMVTPPGGLVLDPFMGSGSTGVAAVSDGFRFVGFEQNPEYVEIARRRIFHALPEFQKEYFKWDEK